MRTIAVLALCTILSGCGALAAIFGGFERQLTEGEVTLQPLALSVGSAVRGAREGPCIGLPVRGLRTPELDQWLADGGPDTGTVLVAYANEFFPGPDPEPCNEWQFPVAQGKVAFDFASIPRGALIDRAVLRASVSRAATRSRGFLFDRDCGGISGFAEVGRTDSLDLAPIGGVADYAPNGVDVGPEMPVRNIVRRFVTEGRRLGQIVLTPKPSFRGRRHDVEDLGRNVRYCAVRLSDFELEIAYRAPPP
jgi:hypothetical protein